MVSIVTVQIEHEDVVCWIAVDGCESHEVMTRVCVNLVFIPHMLVGLVYKTQPNPPLN